MSYEDTVDDERDAFAPRRERAFDELLDDEELTSPTPVPGLLGLSDDDPSEITQTKPYTPPSPDNDFVPVTPDPGSPPVDWGWVSLVVASSLAALALILALGTIAITG